MRNFWLNANIDGRKTPLSGGPKSKEDGMTLDICQRDSGVSLKAITINCYVNNDGKLITRIFNNIKNEVVTEIITDR